VVRCENMRGVCILLLLCVCVCVCVCVCGVCLICAVCPFRWPLTHGVVENWDDVEKIWEYVFFEGLDDVDPENQPVRPF